MDVCTDCDYTMVDKITELTNRIYEILKNHDDITNAFQLERYGLVVSDLKPTWDEIMTAFDNAKKRL